MSSLIRSVTDAIGLTKKAPSGPTGPSAAQMEAQRLEAEKVAADKINQDMLTEKSLAAEKSADAQSKVRSLLSGTPADEEENPLATRKSTLLKSFGR